MKFVKFYMALCALLIPLIMPYSCVAADVEAHQSDFNVGVSFIQGLPPCVLKPIQETIELNFPKKDLVNSQSHKKQFTLEFEKCPYSKLNLMQLIFIANKSLNIGGNEFLVIDRASTATGFVIGLEDKDNRALSFNQQYDLDSLFDVPSRRDAQMPPMKLRAYLKHSGDEINLGPYTASSTVIISFK